MTLLTFVCLQVLDVLTTLLFLRHGVSEANPLIRFALAGASHPLIALAAPKMFAIALGVFAWRSGRTGLLRIMNIVFAACVLWNLAAAAVQ